MTDESPAELRAQALADTLRSAYAQRLAFQRSGDWRQLNYASFPQFIDDRFGQIAVRFAPDERRELVAEMSDEGVPVKDQAAILGVAEPTIERDRRASNDAAAAEVAAPDELAKASNDGSEPLDPVAEFPDLAYYRHQGDEQTVARLAATLRGLPGHQRAQRLEALRRTIEMAEHAVDDDPEPTGPDYHHLVSQMFDAVNAASRRIAAAGGPDAAARVEDADPIELTNWTGQFIDMAATCAALAANLKPKARIRRVK